MYTVYGVNRLPRTVVENNSFPRTLLNFSVPFESVVLAEKPKTSHIFGRHFKTNMEPKFFERVDKTLKGKQGSEEPPNCWKQPTRGVSGVAQTPCWSHNVAKK